MKEYTLTVTLDDVFEHLIPILSDTTVFHGARRPTIIEIGAHDGSTTRWLKAFSARPPLYWMFEPDPRNLRTLWLSSEDPTPCAIWDRAATLTMYLSGGITPGTMDREHTDSSSLKRPTKHLETHPWCKFDQQVEVEAERLDSFIPKGIPIDLIWCDVQGAQLEVIAGGQETLKRTRFLYIEVHPTPLYEGEPTFEQIVAALPGEWRVVERYEADVLFMRVEA